MRPAAARKLIAALEPQVTLTAIDVGDVVLIARALP
jgi:hypothetical protein